MGLIEEKEKQPAHVFWMDWRKEVNGERTPGSVPDTEKEEDAGCMIRSLVGSRRKEAMGRGRGTEKNTGHSFLEGFANAGKT